MSDTSVYDDPIVDILTSSPPTDKDAAKGFLARHNERAATSESKFNDIMKQRAEAMEVAKARLDETIGQMRAKHEGSGFGQVNLPLMSFAAGLLAPAPPGVASNFGQELSRGLSSMGTTIRSQRMQDSEFLKGIAELQAKGDAMSDKPRADAQTAEMRKQIAAETASAGIEKALVRSDSLGGRGTPARLQRLAEFRKIPGNENKSEIDMEKELSDARNQGPAILQEFDRWVADPANKGKTQSDFYREKDRNKAAGHEIGKLQGTAEQLLPAAAATVDQMAKEIEEIKKHPGLPKLFGPINARLMNIPGLPAADAQALINKVKDQAFLVQFDKLRGAGAITVEEGNKATGALTSLSTDQSEKQFRLQLDSALDVLKKGQEVLRQRAGVSGRTEEGGHRPGAKIEESAKPPMPDARKAPDGKWYIEKGGKFFEVRP